MTFIGEVHIGDGKVTLSHGGHQLVRFQLRHARIILALPDEQRHRDVIHPANGRAGKHVGAVFLARRIAHILEPGAL